MKQLKQLPAVINVSPKYITFAPVFKETVVRKYHEGYSGWEIFLEAGFPENVPSSDFIKGAIKRWRTTVSKHGTAGLYASKGRSKKTKQYEEMSDCEKIVYLEAKNAFLVELRAQQQRNKNTK